MEHELRTWPEHYAAIERGAKTCELRLNDRPYQVGDALLLREYEPLGSQYTGQQLRVRVTHILSGGVWLSPGYIAMSIRLMPEDNAKRVDEDWKGVADRQRDELAHAGGIIRDLEAKMMPVNEYVASLERQVEHLCRSASRPLGYTDEVVLVDREQLHALARVAQVDVNDRPAIVFVPCAAPIAAFTLAETWQAEKAALMEEVAELRAGAKALIHEAINPSHDHWNEWVQRLRVVADRAALAAWEGESNG
jgi:tetrahydromethanopterin S-methyltransferase subunit B